MAPPNFVRHFPRPALASERGAFDLPSIITGVVVVGILAAGVLAAIFGIIPFAQDNGAKQDTAAIRTAEAVAKTKDGHYMDSAGLVAAGYLPPAVLSAAPDNSSDPSGFARVSATGRYNYKVSADAAGTCYAGVARSGTGNVYYSTNKTPDPQELAPTTDTGCATVDSTQTLVTAVGGYPAKYIVAAPSGFTGSLSTNTSAIFSWAVASGATGYLVETSVNGGPWTTVAASQPGTNIVITGNQGDKISGRVSSVNAAGTSTPTLSIAVSLPTGPNFASPVVWTKRTAAPAGTWNDLAASSDATKIFASQNGGLYRSADSGATWTKLPAPSATWGKVASSADGTRLMALASNSDIYISADSGATWAKKQSISGLVAIGSSADSKNLISAVYDSAIYTSNNYGASWTGHNLAYSDMWNQVHVSADGTTMTATNGYDPNLYISRDGGVTWSKSPTTNGIGGLALSSDGKTILVAMGTSLRVSTDSGVTFAPASTGVPTNLSFMQFAISSDGTKMVASSSSSQAGAYPGVYTSTDTGKTWIYQNAVGTASTSGTNTAFVSTSADGGKIVAAYTSMFTGAYGG
ncbi:hypothetical protein GCM10023063_16960 [Arthrobacter methylotrophus]|uniref:WD40/YVTN/BNR-like repeat-containing protein n=1 Tax=Arthrobacter methylotrophus TaxID=121291 RepID=A0ABV5UPR9_9MICC